MAYSGEKRESWEDKYISQACPPATLLSHLKKLLISQHMAYEIKQGAPNVRSSIQGGAFALDP